MNNLRVSKVNTGRGLSKSNKFKSGRRGDQNYDHFVTECTRERNTEKKRERAIRREREKATEREVSSINTFSVFFLIFLFNLIYLIH